MMVTSFSASIVLYRNDPAVVSRAIQSTLGTPGLEVLYLIDNSPDPNLRRFETGSRVVYEHLGRNIGFGSGHNRAITRSDCRYHCVINPDVDFAPTVIPSLIETLVIEPRAGIAGPALSTNFGHVEHWCRAQPTPFDLLARRFLPIHALAALQARQARFERHDLPRDQVSDVDVLSGAFLVCSTTLLRRLKGFDPRYFLYLEDYDLCRSAISAGFRCIYDPRQTVIHRRGAHSYSSLRPLLWHVRSAVSYFNKWGWLPFY